VKVQTVSGTTPVSALEGSMRRLETEFALLQNSFREQVRAIKSKEETIG
jgi:hypothetical protein